MSFNENALRYLTSDAHRSFVSARKIHEHIGSSVEKYKKKIVDIGSGAGHFSAQLAYSNDTVFLIDPSLNMLETAEQNLKTWGIKNVETINKKLEDIDQLPLATLYISRMVFHHISNHKNIFKLLDHSMDSEALFCLSDLYAPPDMMSFFQELNTIQDSSHGELFSLLKVLDIISNNFEILLHETNYLECKQGILLHNWCDCQGGGFEKKNKLEKMLSEISDKERARIGFSYDADCNSYRNHLLSQILILRKL